MTFTIYGLWAGNNHRSRHAFQSWSESFIEFIVEKDYKETGISITLPGSSGGDRSGVIKSRSLWPSWDLRPPSVMA